MKILTVEDNPDMRDLLALRVQLTGYLPVLASDGKEGVEKAKAEKPDLILMHMMMPVMDGWGVAKSFVPSRETKDTPILAKPHSFVLRISSRVCTGAVTAAV